MKTAGWVCFIIGILAFIGAAAKENSVFGPLFFIGLGIFFLARGYNKIEQKAEADNGKPLDVKPKATAAAEPKATVMKTDTVPPAANNEPESVEEIQAQLSQIQREAAMCMVVYFAGYNRDANGVAVLLLSKQAAGFLGIRFEEAVIRNLLRKHCDLDKVFDTVMTIRHRKTVEFLLLTCHDLIRDSNNGEARWMLENVANDMGYDKAKFGQLLRQYQN